MSENKRTCLLFSGGYDSLYTSLKVAENSGEIVLLTCDTCTTSANKKISGNIDILKRIAKNTNFSREIASSVSIQKTLLDDFDASCKKYKGIWSPLGIWCCSCQLAMKGAALIYCLENGIKECADGAIRTQDYHSASKARVINAVKNLFSEYGVHYVNPIYESRDNISEILQAKGFNTGRKIFGTSYDIQPMCIVSPVIDLWQQTHDAAQVEDNVMEYVKSKIPVLRQAVNRYFEEKRIPMETFTSKKLTLQETDYLKTFAPAAQAGNHAKKRGLIFILLSNLIPPLQYLVTKQLKKISRS